MMTREFLHGRRDYACRVLLTVALGSGLLNGALADEQAGGQPAPEGGGQAAGPAEQAAPAVEPSESVADPAQAARAAMEERRAKHEARIKEHHKAMRERAAAQGIDLPEPPPMRETPRWLSYEEMRAEMKRRGIDMAPFPGQGEMPELPQPPSMARPTMPPAAMGPIDAEALKGVFDVIDAMTPEQQQACFALSRWHASTLMRPPMHPRMRPPGKGGPMGPQQGHGPGRVPMGPGPMMVPRQ